MTNLGAHDIVYPDSVAIVSTGLSDMGIRPSCRHDLLIIWVPSQNDDLSRADDAIVVPDANNFVTNGAIESKCMAVVSLGEVNKFRLIVESVALSIITLMVSIRESYGAGR